MQKFLFEKLITECKDLSVYELYCNLITFAISENRVKLSDNNKNYIYYEQHHILPKSLYPDFKDNEENIVLLTAREHYLAHKYLVQMFPNSPLVFAFWRLSTDNRGRTITAEEYEYAKKLVSAQSSKLNKGRKCSRATRDKLRNARLGYKHSDEVKLKISKSHIGKRHAQETKLKMSIAKQGKPGNKWSEESKANLSARYKGSGNPMYGKSNKEFMTDEEYNLYKQKLSKALIGHEVSEETRRKLSKAAAGRFSGGRNPKAKHIFCIEDNLTFNTLAECANYYNLARYKMTAIAKSGYSNELQKTFKILER